MSKSSSGNDAESTALGWKFIIIVAAITTIFFTFLYLAMSSEPDYMPNQEAKKVITNSKRHRNPHLKISKMMKRQLNSPRLRMHIRNIKRNINTGKYHVSNTTSGTYR